MKSALVSFNCGCPRQIHKFRPSILSDEKIRVNSKVNFPKEFDQTTPLPSSNKFIDDDSLSKGLKGQRGSCKKFFASNIPGKHVATALPKNISPRGINAKNHEFQACFNQKHQLPSILADLNTSESRSGVLSMSANGSCKFTFEKDDQKCESSHIPLLNRSSNQKLFIQESESQSNSLKSLEKSLREKLLARPPNIIYDHMAPTPSQLLETTIRSYLPFVKSYLGKKLCKGKFSLPPGHHLVYFNQQVATSDLLPDGTDDLHSPGYPFERRLWVGGSIDFIRPMTLFPKIQMISSEEITDVRVTGTHGDEKVFVDITRQIINPYLNMLQLKELRTLVFMRRKSSKEMKERKNALKPKMEPYFSIIVRPTRTLLFRFSALTFNSHRIHLDSTYCRQVEGLKCMIVQGPLAVVLMLAVLKEQLWSRARIDAFTYRNIAPLYVEEDMKICVKKGAKKNGVSTWHVWIEGPLGGYAVKGTATISWVGNQRLKRKKKEPGVKVQG